MRSGKRFAILVMLGVTLCGWECADEARGEVLARAGGEEVSTEEFEAFLGGKLESASASDLREEEKEQFLKAYILLRRLADESKADEEGWKKVREALMRRAMVREIRRAPVTERVSISDEELRAYYHLHKAEFKEEETYVFRHVFFNTIEPRMLTQAPMVAEEDRLSPAELEKRIEEKRQRAQEAYRRLLAGEDFGAVAREYSDSGGEERPEERGIQMLAVKRSGGLYVRDRRIMERMEEVILSLEVGEISEVFETKYGIEIVKLERHAPGGVPAFEEVRERIARQLGRSLRRDLKEETDEGILSRFEVEERYWVLRYPEAATDELVFSLSGPGGESRFTVGDYRDFLGTLPPSVRESLEESSEKRVQYLHDYVLLDEAAYLLAQHQGLESDEELKAGVEAELIESMALEEFNRRVSERVEATPVEEKDLQEIWSDPINQRIFSVGEEVCVEAFAVGTMATPEASPSGQHFGRQFALRLAQKIVERLRAGDSYLDVAAAFTLAPTEEAGMAYTDSLEGGVEVIKLTGRPIGSHRVRALWDIGWITADDLLRMGVTSPQAAKAVAGMASGAVTEAPLAYRVSESDELPGPEGYLVMRIVRRREPYVRPLSQVREQVERMLRGQRMRRMREQMYAEMVAAVEYDLNRSAWDALWRRVQES